MLLGFRFCGLFWRSDNCQHVGLLPKILRRYPLDVVECHSIHFGFQFLIMIKAESIKFVEPSHIGKHVVTLVLDLLLTDQLFLRPRQLGRNQTLAGELVNLMQKSLLNWLYFLRISPEIKREKARDQGLDLGGTDIIGETHLLAYTNEQTRAQVAARFIDSFERITIGVKEIGSTEAGDQNRLRLVACCLHT